LATAPRDECTIGVLGLRDPDSLETATCDAANLLHFGSLEAKLGLRAAAAKDLRKALEMLQRQAMQSPKNRHIDDLCRRAETALAANQATWETKRDEFPRQPGK
jgi:hypothetical protein